MNRTITFLVDNRAEKPFVAEHGISFLLETQGKRILFDTGQDKALFHNSRELGISLADLDALVLSHGHYDHGGNLAEVFSLNPSIRFFAHPDCLIPRWSLNPGMLPKSVGLSPEDNAAILNLQTSQLHWCEKPTEILPDVWITGAIPRESTFEDVGGPFFLDEGGEIPDIIGDDMALWICGESGLMVICGCCHSGVKNTIDYIASLSGKDPIQTLAGGLHLVNADEERLAKTVSFLNEKGIRKVIPAHCTGETGMALLQEQLNAEVQLGIVGLQVDF